MSNYRGKIVRITSGKEKALVREYNMSNIPGAPFSYQDWFFTAEKELSDATGLANDATEYTASITVDDQEYSLTIVGSEAQTLGDLIDLINGQIIGAEMSLTKEESGTPATSGSATISNTGALGEFVNATVPAIVSETYDIDIEIDGVANALAVALLNTDDWAGIASKIQTALQTATTSTETVAIVGGKIKVSSVTTGITSTVVISAGTTGSAGGDLLDAIDALGADYTVTLDAPVDGLAGVPASTYFRVIINNNRAGSYNLEMSDDDLFATITDLEAAPEEAVIGVALPAYQSNFNMVKSDFSSFHKDDVISYRFAGQSARSQDDIILD